MRDALVAIGRAATYPLELVEVDRFVKKELKGDTRCLPKLSIGLQI